MKRFLIILLAVLIAAPMALAQYNNVYIEGLPALTGERHTYDFKCGRQTLRLEGNGHPAMLCQENDFGGHYSLTLAFTRKSASVLTSVIDKKTGAAVRSMYRNGNTEYRYLWEDGYVSEYVVTIDDDYREKGCIINKVMEDGLSDVGGVIYRFMIQESPENIRGMRVMDGRKVLDVTDVDYAETDMEYSYDATLSGGNHIRMTFLKDDSHTPRTIDIRTPSMTAKGDLVGERGMMPSNMLAIW